MASVGASWSFSSRFYTEEWKGGQHGFLAHRLADITPFILFRERRIFSPST